MLNSSILDVAIGMAFIYLLLSLIASTIQEVISSVLQLRPANLEHGIRSLFSGGELATGIPFVDRLYRHGLIMGLYREHIDPDGKVGNKFSPLRNWLRRLFRVHPTPPIPGVSDPFFLPAYIPARTFAIALLDILKVEAENKKAEDARLASEAEKAKAALPEAVAQKAQAALAAAEAEKARDMLVKAEAERADFNNPDAIALPAEIAPPVPAAGSSALPSPTVSAPPPPDPLKDVETYLQALCTTQKAISPTTGYAAAEAMLSLLTDARTLDGSTAQLEKFRCHIENWYSDSMDRASGWYKKYTQNVLLVIGLIMAIAFNVDSINVGKTLWFDKDVRSNLITAAGKYVDKNTPGAAAPGQEEKTELDQNKLTKQMSTTVAAFNEVSRESLLPVGWHYKKETYEAYRYNLLHPGRWIINPVHWRWSDLPNWNWPKIVSQAVGWCITALALSLGAPFWFDLLNKFMVVRSTVKPQEKSRTEGSKDAT